MITKFKSSVIILILLTGILQAQSGSSITKTGMTAAPFLTIDVGSRSKAMGGAFVAVANDLSSFYWNPAGLANIDKTGITFSHMKWIAEINFDFAGVNIPVGNLGNIGAWITTVSMPEMEVRTVYEQEGTGEFFSASDLALGLSYSRNITERFSIGMNFKYIQEKIYKMTANTTAIDFGTLFRTGFNDMVIGMSISNFGGYMQMLGIDTQVDYDITPGEGGNNDRILANLRTENFQLPLTFRVGLAMDIFKSELNYVTIAADAVVPNDNAQYVNIGTEYNLWNLISLRAGYKSLLMPNSEEGLTLGAGINQSIFGGVKLTVDYVYGDFGLLNNIQELSLNIYF